MSYEEKNTWAFGLIAPLGYAVYIALTFLVGDGPLDASSYMWPMLWAMLLLTLAMQAHGISSGSSWVCLRLYASGWMQQILACLHRPSQFHFAVAFQAYPVCCKVFV